MTDATTSLGGLLGISTADLVNSLKECEIDWHHPSMAPEDQVVLHLWYEDVHDLPRPVGIRWFHATRASVGAFEEGLLPTLAALPKLLDFLRGIAAKWISPEKWGEYQRSLECSDRPFAQQFRRKRIAAGWEGPFAFLIKDAALDKHDEHKDFTRICETLEDVCADFQQVFGYPLREARDRVWSSLLGPATGTGRSELPSITSTGQSLGLSKALNATRISTGTVLLCRRLGSIRSSGYSGGQPESVHGWREIAVDWVLDFYNPEALDPGASKIACLPKGNQLIQRKSSR